jgi:hypothetical protein
MKIVATVTNWGSVVHCGDCKKEVPDEKAD